MIIWLYGRPCSGKTTISNVLRASLEGAGNTVLSLDGDIVRKSLSSDLGYEPSDRLENVRRIASVAKLLYQEVGIRVDYLIVSSIAPLAAHRDLIRSILGDVLLIYLKAGLGECSKRDLKGLYRSNATGIREFEESEGDLSIPTEGISVGESSNLILNRLWKTKS
jgi:bifunctional enzyme CysN/CysC